jgi:DNA-directed RNA polymerase I, II, and III subunit RPABC5
MLIPIRCVSCNNILAGKWKTYQEKIKAYRKAEGRPENDEIQYLTVYTRKTAEGKALDELGLTRECCRSRMLTHVDLL